MCDNNGIPSHGRQRDGYLDISLSTSKLALKKNDIIYYFTTKLFRWEKNWTDNSTDMIKYGFHHTYCTMFIINYYKMFLNRSKLMGNITSIEQSLLLKYWNLSCVFRHSRNHEVIRVVLCTLVHTLLFYCSLVLFRWIYFLHSNICSAHFPITEKVEFCCFGK